MNKRIAYICIHGYNVDDYRNSTGRVSRLLKEKGFFAHDLIYHADDVRSARKKNGDIARRLHEIITLMREGGYADIAVIAHSNGNAALRLCYDLYRPWVDYVFCVQPALPSEIHPYPTAKTFVFYNKYDNVVVLGKWLTFLTKLVSTKWAAARNWGDMGKEGYNGEDETVINIDTAYTFEATGHSGLFENDSVANLLTEFIIFQTKE